MGPQRPTFLFFTVISLLFVATTADFLKRLPGVELPGVEHERTTARQRISPLPLVDGELKSYIVHVQAPEATTFSTAAERERWYRSFLPVTGVEYEGSISSRLLYAYHDVISGFAARLTEEELQVVRQKEGFVHAYPDSVVQPHTTRTPAYLGLGLDIFKGLWSDTNFGSGVIIGVLDTGITPGHPSFADGNMPPPPSTWKGSCQSPVQCNNKLIGAKAFGTGIQAIYGGEGHETLVSSDEEEKPSLKADPIDQEGHGTHTASTAAGRSVPNAGVYGQATGTASGIAPNAWLATYRVCYPNKGCANSDILAAYDAALSDGVDILSLSLGGGPIPFYQDNIAIGAFSAIQKGVFVSCSAGNSGPTGSTVSNDAPWILTVAAGTSDRTIKARVVIGDGTVFDGQSLAQPTANLSFSNLRVVYPGADGTSNSRFCLALSRAVVAGKIVVCDAGGADPATVVKNAGGVAMILVYYQVAAYNTFVQANVLPTAIVRYPDGSTIKAYASQSASPTASIQFLGTTIGISPPASMVAYFSSRGPSVTNTDLIKPDVLGPGVDILAAWPSQVGPALASAPFNIISGTSMSAPHLSGVAALIKSAHPDWSPAAIRSAMMTSSTIMNNVGQFINDENLNFASFFLTGAGQVNPQKATTPGLIYDLTPQDYVQYLCSIKYTDAQVSVIARRQVVCANERAIQPANLNYPTMSITIGKAVGSTVTVTRTVTNVGDPTSTYVANMFPSSGTSATVEPSTLQFTATNERIQFQITFTSNTDASGITSAEALLIWSSPATGITVQSPIMVKFV